MNLIIRYGVAVEPEPTESKPAPKLESNEVDSSATSDTSEINLAPIKKIDAIFQCDKCPVLMKISGNPCSNGYYS